MNAAIERARIQIELWDEDGMPELEYRGERLRTLIKILRAIVDAVDHA